MRIVFEGTHGTGKSTLMNLLRPYIENHRYYKEEAILAGTSYQFFDGISSKVNNRNWSASANQRFYNYYYVYRDYCHSCFVASRGIYGTWAYSRIYHGLYRNLRLFSWASRHIWYDHVFYLPVEFDVGSEGKRPVDPVIRVLHDKEVKILMDMFHVAYHIIDGSIEERLFKVRKILNV